MPWGLKRFYGAGDLHFITASCYRRGPHLALARDRDLFLRVLEQVRQRYQFVIVAYVVMPEHFHLLISEPQKANPSVVIQALKLGVARRILSSRRRKQKRKAAQEGLWSDPVPQHFWQARFYDFNVWTRKKRVEKLRYIHRNPVRRGLVESPDQWRWSSYRAYAFGESGVVRVNDWSVLTMKLREPASFTTEKSKSAQASGKSPTSRKPREVGHPRVSLVRQTWHLRPQKLRGLRASVVKKEKAAFAALC